MIHKAAVFFQKYGFDDIKKEEKQLLEFMKNDVDNWWGYRLGQCQNDKYFVERLYESLKACPKSELWSKFICLKKTIDQVESGADPHLLNYLQERGIKETFIAYGFVQSQSKTGHLSYEDIIISVPVTINQSNCTYTQYGLIKNPLYMVGLQKYQNTSMIITGFIAKCLEKKINQNGVYLSTRPMVSFLRIIEQSIGKKNIHLVVSKVKIGEEIDPKEYGVDILRKCGFFEEERYQIIDPRTNKASQIFKKCELTSSPGYGGELLIIKTDKLKMFYDESIESPIFMLSFLKELEKVKSPLPPKLAHKIESIYPGAKKNSHWFCNRPIGLKDAIGHYKSLQRVKDQPDISDTCCVM